MNHSQLRKCARMLFGTAASLLALFLATDALAAKSPITMEDMLNAESIGDVVFSPTGQTFAFVRSIPTAKQSNWGYDDADLVRSRVFVMHRGGSPKEIPNTSDVHYSLAPDRAWSPDGRYLLLLATTHQGYGLAVYDIAHGRITSLPGYLDNLFPTFDWTSDDRIIYFSTPAGVLQRAADNQVLETLTKRWQAAWNRSTPQVTISSNSPVFATSEPPKGSLALFDPRHGGPTVLATGNYYAISVAPDGKHFAAVCGAERLPTSLNFHSRRGELQIFGLAADGHARLLDRYGDVDMSASVASGSSLSWSPSGSRLLVVGVPMASRKLDTHLYVVDIGTGKLHTIEAPGLSFVNPGAGDWGMTLPIGWLGDHPIAVATHAANSTRQAARNPGSVESQLEYGEARNLRFDVYAFDGDRPEDLTAFAKASVDQFLVPQDAGHAMVVADGALWKVAPGDKPVKLSPDGTPAIVGFGTDRHYPQPPPGTAYYHSGQQQRIGLYAIGGNGKPERVVLDLQSRQLSPLKVAGTIEATAPGQLVTLSKVDKGWATSLLLNDGGEQTILTINEKLKDRAIAPVQPFKFTYQGKPLSGWVVLPSDAKLGTALPAVVSVYGGIVYGREPPFATKAEISLPIFSGQLLAAQGYAVIYPSTPLGPGSSTNVMETLAGEAIAAVDALSAKGIVDPKRVGVTGQSFGGFSTAAILAERSDRFKAGVAMAGIYDWIFGYGMLPMDKILTDDGDIYDLEIKMVENGQIQLHQPFWKAADAYERNSPIFSVEKIDSPILFLHGDLDLGVTGLPGAERMYNALLRVGKTTALVRYWGQGHVAQSAPAIRDQWFRMTAWFAHYVKSGP